MELLVHSMSVRGYQFKGETEARVAEDHKIIQKQ